jgi:hypothetical protein
MGGFKLTGLGAGTTAGDSLTYDQLAANSTAGIIGANDGASGAIYTTVQGALTYNRGNNGSTQLGFILPSASGQGETASAKMAQMVDVYDALTPAMRADVNGGSLLVDCSSAINAIINYAVGGESAGNATGGTTLYFKGGRYLHNSQLTNLFRRTNSIIDDGDLRRVNFMGDGSCNTSLFYGGPSGTAAYTAAGYKSAGQSTGVAMYHVIKGIRFRRFPISSLTGTGLQFDDMDGIFLDDVQVDGFNLGIDARDIIGFNSINTYVVGNTVGLWAQTTDYTYPNIWTMRGGACSGNINVAARFTQACNVLLDSVRFEANGLNNNSDQVILFEGGSAQGGASLTVQNGYFEGNMALSDINLVWSTTDAGVVDIRGNTFQKTDATRYVKHHIDASVVGAAVGTGARLTINHGPNAYKSFGAYVPSSANAVLRIQTAQINVQENAANFYQNAVELPQTNSFPMVGYGYSNIAVAARVTSAGVFVNGYNVASTSRVSVGIYQINFVKSNQFIVGIPAISIIGNDGYGYVSSEAVNNIQVTTKNNAGVLTDQTFSVILLNYPGF